MSNAIAGYKGTVEISTDGGTTYNKVAEVKDIDLQVQQDMIDVTSHDSNGNKEYTPGGSDWSGTISELYIETDAQQAALRNAILNKTSLNLRFRPRGAGAGIGQYTGLFFIKDFKVASHHQDAAMTDLTIQGTGPLTFSNQ